MDDEEDVATIKLVPVSLASKEEDDFDDVDASPSSTNPMLKNAGEEKPSKNLVTGFVEDTLDFVAEKISEKVAKGDVDRLSGKVGISSADLEIIADKFGIKSEVSESVFSDDFKNDFTLHQAAGEGDIDIVKNLLEQYERDGLELFRIIDRFNLQDYAPLHLAARYGRKNVVGYLLEREADIDLPGGEDSMTPLHLATKYDMTSVAKLLIEKGANLQEENRYGTTALHFAARRGNMKVCQMLLDNTGLDSTDGGQTFRKANPDVTDNAGATPLHSAMLSGNVALAKLLIESGANVSAEDSEGERPIHFAAAEDQADLIIELANGVLKGVPEQDIERVQIEFVNAVTGESDTALHIAAQAGYEETVKTLISIGANVNARTDTNSTPLHLAAVAGQLGVIRYLAMSKAKINALDDQQMTPLHRACQYGRLNVAKFLIERGAKLEAGDKDSFTPLMCAVWKGKKDTVEYLLDQGAQWSVLDINNKTVLHVAVEENNIETLKLLIQRGAGSLLNNHDKEQKTPLHLAALNGNDQILDILLSKSAEVDFGDHEDKTPLHVAAEMGHKNCVTMLGVASPGSVNSTDERGRSPLHHAAINGHAYVCSTLIEMGAETSCRDDVNWTPLDYAARNGFSKTVSILLDNDAPVDACDKNKTSPLHHAASNGHVDCINLLLDHGARIDLETIARQNCLDLAVENNQKEACMALLKHKRWKEVLTHVDADGYQPLEKLIAVAPEVAELVLNNCVTTSKHTKSDPEYCETYNFEFLDLPPDRQKGDIYFGPANMVRHQRESLLSHKLTVMLIKDKWARLGRWIYLLSLFVYLLFVALLTSLLVIDKERSGIKDPMEKNTFQMVVPWLALLLAFVQIVKEVIQMSYLRLRYFKDPVNYLEMLLYVTTFLFMMPFIIQSVDDFFENGSVIENKLKEYADLENIKWQAGSISILTAWLNLLLYLQRFPLFGLYVVMFVEVLKTLLMVISVFSVVLIAFSLSFYVLLGEQKAFEYAARSIFKTSVMTIGEFEFDAFMIDNINNPNLLPYKAMTFIIFYLFLILMPILLMNLLIGLAVGDIEAVRKSAYLLILKAQVHILKTIEHTYPKQILGAVYRKELKVYPKGRSLYQRFIDWFGSYNYESLKDTQMEMGGKEDVILHELENNRIDLEKQKKRMKVLLNLVVQQQETTAKIVQKLSIE